MMSDNHRTSRATVVRFLLMFPMLSGAVACSQASEVTLACTIGTVTASAPLVTLTVGQTTQAVARYSVQNCSPLPTVAWTTDNAAIATVSSTGLISAVAVGGPVSIRATVASQISTVSITVR